MSAVPQTNLSDALSRFLRPLSGKLGVELARALIELQADTELQRRYEELAQKNTEGAINSAESDELACLAQCNEFVATLKAAARVILARSDGLIERLKPHHERTSR
jgi:hypothetical protein